MIPFNPFSAITSKIYGALAIAALMFAGVQTLRIDGLHIWPIGINGLKADNDSLRFERDGWRKAKEVTRKSNDTLTAELHEQNAAVDHMKAEADKRQQAGQAALAGAKGRSAVREGLAARIDAERASAGSGDDCRTSAVVMAARNQF